MPESGIRQDAKRLSYPSVNPTRVARLYGISMSSLYQIIERERNQIRPHDTLTTLAKIWFDFGATLDREDPSAKWLRWLNTSSSSLRNQTPMQVLEQRGVEEFARRVSETIPRRWYVERESDGKFSVRKSGADRASAIEPTQSEAIERARKMDPSAPIHVERVRSTNADSIDKWRSR